MDQIAEQGNMNLSGLQESAWIEVIHKMDEVYADLIHYEVELEEKNSALEQAHRLIASVLSSMSDLLIVCDEKGRIEQVNQALESITGRDTASLMGISFQELFSEESRPLTMDFSQRLQQGDIHDCELGLISRDGSILPLAVNCSTRYDHEGRLAGMVLIARPVGELKRAYEALHLAHQELQEAQSKLIQSEKMASLGRLVAGVAHELNNPISFVYGNTHSLKRYGQRLKTYIDAIHGDVDTEQLQQLRRELRIDRIMDDMESLIAGTLEGAERTRDIVEDLRRFSTSSRDKNEIFDLSHTVRTAVHWATRGSRRELALICDLPEQLLMRGNAGQLHQVVLNLVQNAIDATEDTPAPRLQISARVQEQKILLRFQDNGPGIDAEHMLKVFDPFFTTKAVGRGTGLGLSISYGIIEDHGGRLTAGNHEQGGAVFSIELPLPETGASVQEAPQP